MIDLGFIVCKCFTVTKPYIRRKIKELNLRTIPEITNGHGAPRLPNTLNVSCHFIEGEGILFELSAAGILRIERIGLHVGLPGAFPRFAGDEGALHRGTRLGAVQLEPL